MRDAPPTSDETAFYEGLRVQVPALQDWYHQDENGTFWMTVSYDDVCDGTMTATWRVDFDGYEVVAGRSPSNLNWDDGVRARDAGMDLVPPYGLVREVRSVEEAVRVVAEWLGTVTDGRATA